METIIKMAGSNISSPNFNLFPLVELPSWTIKLIFALFMIYILVFAFLQARQIGVLQGKVKTDADPVMKLFGYLYFIVQVLLFVVVLVIL